MLGVLRSAKLETVDSRRMGRIKGFSDRCGSATTSRPIGYKSERLDPTTRVRPKYWGGVTEYLTGLVRDSGPISKWFAFGQRFRRTTSACQGKSFPVEHQADRYRGTR